MILVGCDLHTRKQQVALLNTETGELRDQELSHVGDDVERFYAALSPPVTVGIESTGYSLWFHALLRRLGDAGSVVMRTGGPGLSRPADVAMMQATDFGNLYDPARPGELDGPDVR